MSSTKTGSRFGFSNTGDRSPSPPSRPRDRFGGLKRSEPERLDKRQQDKSSSNHEDDDREVCMKKLSEFNESLRRQGQSTSTKFQWNHLLLNNPGAAAAVAATKPGLAMRNEATAPTYSMSPMGIGIGLTKENRLVEPRPLHLRPGFANYNRGMMGEAVDFGVYGENVGFDSSVISEMAMNRIRRTEEATEFAHRKMEALRARASAVDSIIDKVDGGVGGNRAVELDRPISLSQQYMNGQKRELLHGERYQQREDCSPHALTQRYADFSVQREEIVGIRMGHSQSPRGALFDGERQRLGEVGGRVLPPFYHELKEKSYRNEIVQENGVLGGRMNQARSQNEAGYLGERQQFQHSLFGKSHEMEHGKELCCTMMNCHRSPKRSPPLHGEWQELPENYGRSIAPNHFDFGRESHVKEQLTNVSGFRMNSPLEQKRALLKSERLGLSEDYGHSFPPRYLDFNVESHEKQQANELLGSRMNPLVGEKQQMQEDCSHSLPQHHLGLHEKSHVMELETEVLASRTNHHQPQDQTGAFLHGEVQLLQKDCAMGSYPLPKQDDSVCTSEGGIQLISATEEPGINSQSSTSHPKKRIIDLRKIRETRISRLTRISDASDGEILNIRHEGEQLRGEDFEQQLLQRDSGFESPKDERDILFDEYLPSTRKNIKQRLGPSCEVHNPNPSNRESVKQRLGPPCQVHNPKGMPQVEGHGMRKRLKENVYDFQGVQARDVDLPDVKRGRTEPHEDTEEFKKLIHVAFVKFVKVLNENPAQRRKYTQKGEAETLKCCVCGSKSKEFVNTLSLVMHAFTSRSVGHRVDHLGFHKALCLLMGWSSMAASNGLWTPKTLPDAEALAMKEDLIVWPPAVILHNSSIATSNSDDRIIFSIEELEAFIEDMGFGREISKVRRGKPANQSIMTVIFHGTFSGLLEAERLHKLYSENKHGRAEFERINCSIGEQLKVPTGKVEDALYGYLGIAGDLDKLDFETKSRSTVKSKKEIYAIADALLNNDKL
ncbi:hypothetical protein PTKIN_Ptkin11bG0055200 [Pterospermum kingtungense]